MNFYAADLLNKKAVLTTLNALVRTRRLRRAKSNAGWIKRAQRLLKEMEKDHGTSDH